MSRSLLKHFSTELCQECVNYLSIPGQIILLLSGFQTNMSYQNETLQLKPLMQADLKNTKK